MTLVCSNVNCPYIKAGVYCGKEISILNQYGACVEFWTKNMQQKMPSPPPTEMKEQAKS